jgi:hypothetical protein
MSSVVRPDVPLETPERYSFVVAVEEEVAAVVPVVERVLLPVYVYWESRIPLSPYNRSSDICRMTDRFWRNTWDRSNRVLYRECRAIADGR